ncbi:MAG TPA: S8 family serine peptidase [Candidatus Angelobacter sp.]|nr:S8 family serine peptidase [Candidatus Angelobacter sp.]
MLAQSDFVLVTNPSEVQDVCSRHGLTQVGQLSSGSPHGVFLVSASSVDSSIASDIEVQSFESDRHVGVAELSGTTSASLSQSSTSILDQLPGRAAVTYFGSTVANYYVSQAATSLARLGDVQSTSSWDGAGITVAVIDTGVDPSHPALSGVLLPGYDFVHDMAGASELVDLSPDMAASLSQSSTSILDGDHLVQMNSFTMAVLSQSSTSILDGPPESFGHGTMTAGLVHLVAPKAWIMPLKAFSADGSSDLFNIVKAIYYAVDNGANVISMSFEIPQSSPALQDAIQYALSKNVTLVAASGNDGQEILVYPAGYNSVIGVGSTSNTDGKSVFTNFGTNSVFVAAPGEGVITTYPGGNYAAGWGTSFSAPLVAGEAALVLQARPDYRPGDVANAVSRAIQVQQMGHGRVDFCQALSNIGAGKVCF